MKLPVPVPETSQMPLSSAPSSPLLSAPRTTQAPSRREWSPTDKDRAQDSGSVLQDELRALLGDHGRRRIGIARGDTRHDRGVDDPQGALERGIWLVPGTGTGSFMGTTSNVSQKTPCVC